MSPLDDTIAILTLLGCKVGDDLVPPGKVVEVEATPENIKHLDVLFREGLAMPADPALLEPAPLPEAPEPEVPEIDTTNPSPGPDLPVEEPQLEVAPEDKDEDAPDAPKFKSNKHKK